MRKYIIIATLVLSGLTGKGQNQNSLRDSLYHHDNGEKIYIKEVDNLPVYPKGDTALFAFIIKNIVYPIDAKEKEIQGTVYSSFVVEKNGDITDLKIIKGLNESCNKEVLRLLKLLSNGWTPAINHGQPVRYQYILPIKFTMKGKTK